MALELFLKCIRHIFKKKKSEKSIKLTLQIPANLNQYMHYSTQATRNYPVCSMGNEGGCRGRE